MGYPELLYLSAAAVGCVALLCSVTIASVTKDAASRSAIVLSALAVPAGLFTHLLCAHQIITLHARNYAPDSGLVLHLLVLASFFFFILSYRRKRPRISLAALPLEIARSINVFAWVVSAFIQAMWVAMI